MLPAVSCGTIQHKGREWPAPPQAWARAIDYMLMQRAQDRIELPLTGHGYLLAVLAGYAEKQEAAAEAEREAAAIVRLATVADAARRGRPANEAAAPADADAHERARAFAEPLLAGERLDSGEGALAHADGVAALLRAVPWPSD